MSKVLCLYYSRTGHTRQAMKEIAQALDAELVELHDQVNRKGLFGWLRCGLDAMRKGTCPLKPYETQEKLSDYDLVILGTPIWAGRCSSVIRGFLKRRGLELERVAYVVTRGGEAVQREVYEQMDLFVPNPRQAAVSLQPGSVGYHFWQEQFIQKARDYLSQREGR